MILATIIAKKTKFRAISKQKRKHQKVISFLWKENKHSTDPCLLKCFNIPSYWDFPSFLINKPQCPLKYFLIYFRNVFRWITNYTCLAYFFFSLSLDTLDKFEVEQRYQKAFEWKECLVVNDIMENYNNK